MLPEKRFEILSLTMIYDMFHVAKGGGWWVFSRRQWISLLGGRYITKIQTSEAGVRCVSRGVRLLELATMVSDEPGMIDSINFLFSTVL